MSPRSGSDFQAIPRDNESLLSEPLWGEWVGSSREVGMVSGTEQL